MKIIPIKLLLKYVSNDLLYRNVEVDQLMAENQELKRQNEYLMGQLMNDRRLFVNEKEELDAKIKQLEEMNAEMITKDYDVGVLEQELSKVNDLLRTSKSRESELEKELLLSSFGE